MPETVTRLPSMWFVLCLLKGVANDDRSYTLCCYVVNEADNDRKDYKCVTGVNPEAKNYSR